MPERDLEKLLGGFAADTLTQEERQLLYRGALQDQELFNALADEQALKELLADPVVRRRLLDSLNRTTAGAGGAWAWLDWLRRPATLAYAGGLAAVALAVVLGTIIYQDSLKQAGRTGATEEYTPASPPLPTPPTSPPAPSPLIESPQGKETEAPVTALSTSSEEAAARADQKSAANGAPPTAQPAEPSQAFDVPAAPPTPGIKAAQPIAAAPSAGTVASTTQGPGARALYYQAVPPSGESEGQTEAMQEAQPGVGPPGEGASQGMIRRERKRETARKPDSKKQPAAHPIGLRYSLIMKGPGGIDLEVDPTTPVGKDDAPRLAVQTNEDGYVSVHAARSTSDTPTLLFPASGDGRVAGRKPIAIALDPVFDPQRTAEPVRLLLVFSRLPHDVNSPTPTRKNLPHLLIDRVDPSQPGAPAEQAVYVVDPTPAASLAIEVPLSLRP